MTQANLILTNAAQRHAGAKRNQRDGKALKKAGQAQVLDNAPGAWHERALFLLNVYVHGLGIGALFAMEDARAYMAACGLPEPHHHNCWGALPQQAVAAGLPIRRTDLTRPAHSPRTHHHPVNLWEVTA